METHLQGCRCLVQQGYAVGNGVTDDQVDGNAIIPFAYGKSLLSAHLYTDLMQTCQGSFWNATDGKPSPQPSHPYLKCTVYHQGILVGCWVVQSKILASWLGGFAVQHWYTLVGGLYQSNIQQLWLVDITVYHLCTLVVGFLHSSPREVLVSWC